jgi:hypothetical protein
VWIAQYRRFWEESFDRLDSLLKTLQANQTAAAKDSNSPKPNTRTKTKVRKEKRNVRDVN